MSAQVMQAREEPLNSRKRRLKSTHRKCLRIQYPRNVNCLFGSRRARLLLSWCCIRSSGTAARLEGQKRFSAHFFPRNAIVLMLNFAKVGPFLSTLS